ncbi:glucokinase [Breoghania corrubedonensis]|uniref:Glucokinase n=1 Tax=Breoghania corrubedonensis TaxID=665038 RepID=A0A2T5VFH0_9HYPH|nr:glucokinase [Breoghania corrubedonensis]PTW62515.1 glucokinase [Breoghania corrubedonensis]
MISTSRDVPSFSFPVLVADVGGTNARFAMVSDAHANLSKVVTAHTHDHPEGMAKVIADRVLAQTSLIPRTAVIAMAGPIQGERTKLTNAPWTVDPNELIRELGLDTVVLLNDFEAQALSLLTLEGGDLTQISRGDPLPYAPKVVVGPGTGLGAGALIHAADRWVPIPGEGGHVELGPVSEEEYRIWPHIERLGGRIGAEQVISGDGLVRLSRAVARADGKEPRFSVAAEVVAAAREDDADAKRTLELFTAALGRVAGDMALMMLARGGVYLAGGIPPHIESFLADGPFRDAFEAKAPHEAIMKTIPAFIIKHPQPALEGLAGFARTPSRFAIDLIGRMWRATPAS